MKQNLRRVVMSLAILLGTSGTAMSATPDAAPVNPNASPEARALLREIDLLSGHYTLTGQHNFPNHVSRWSDRIYDLTGKYPALFGQDFGFSGGDDKDSTEGRPAMIEEVKRQYRNGAVIALTWHAVRPTEDEPVTFRESVQGHLSDYEWKQLLTPGTELHTRWLAQVDVVAGYLRALRDAGVPVLFRAYHEMNGNWFWWGGRPGPDGSEALYREIYDRYVNYHHLNNLIWVWNVNAPGGNAGPIDQYYPGPQYADVLTIDIYGEFKQSYYDSMLALAGNKPIAVAELGAVPPLAVLARQPRWAYFMMWSGMAEGANSPEHLQEVFHAPTLLSRDDPQFAAVRAAAKIPPSTPVLEPVSHDASPLASALLRRLAHASSEGVLSGQENTEAAPAAATAAVHVAAGKYPAIYAVRLDQSTGPDLAAAMAEASTQAKAGAIVSLTWRPPSPTGDAAPTPGQSAPLTDYEWKQLLTPGTALYARWCDDVDGVAAALKRLESEGIAVLWSPYPEANSKKDWWAGRPGITGSAALYRMLFDRLNVRDGAHNLLWVWQPAQAGYGPGASGAYADFSPGLLYMDAIMLDTGELNERSTRGAAQLGVFGAGKPVGVEVDGPVPDPSMFAAPAGWAWFVLAPQSALSAAATGRLQSLYGDSHVLAQGASR